VSRKKLEPEYDHAVHMKELLRPYLLRKTINAVVRVLKGKKYDAIAFTGQSGSLLAGPLAVRLGKPLIMVRKKAKPVTHSQKEVEGIRNARSYVIVDDVICTGATIRRIRAKIREWSPNAKFVGLVQSYYALEDNKSAEFVTDNNNPYDVGLLPHPEEKK
jgi:adenine/guanine phosphoribosyltransferase-like PRPP-binding protein